MAWKFPVSTSTNGVAVPLLDGDSAFVADSVLVASATDMAIDGRGSDHQVIVAGTVTSGGIRRHCLFGRSAGRRS